MITRAFTLIVILAVSVFASAPTHRSNDSRRPPNIVLFYVDDLGWTDVGCFGSEFYETPHIDALAKDGLRLTSAYANAPNCAPSRACLMSGLLAPRHGIYTVNSAKRGRAAHRQLEPVKNKTVLSEEFTTLAEALKMRGYATAMAGKWHLGDDPTSQGFDVNIGGYKAGHPKSYFSPYKNPNLEDGPSGEYLTDRLTDEAIRFIESHREKPFFLYMSHYAVHTPIQAKKEVTAQFKEKSPSRGHKNARYAAMIASMDDSLGRLRATLAKLKLAEDTVIVFFSDNGGHGRITSAKPLRGAKGMMYEGGIRVPMIATWPGRIEARRSSDTPVQGTDLFPTFLELSGADMDEWRHLDGVSLAGHWARGEALPDRALHWHFPAYLEGGRHMRWRTTPAAAVRLGQFKLIEFFEGGLELYDLSEDIGESKNLAQEQPETVKRLREEMSTWRRRTRAFVPTERNPDYKPK